MTFEHRARLTSDAGKCTNAQADYALAAKRAPPDLLPAWYRVRIHDNIIAGRWQTAAWYIDRLLPHAPKDWQLHFDRAVVMAHLKKDAEYDVDLARAVACGADAECLLALADDFVRQSEYA